MATGFTPSGIWRRSLAVMAGLFALMAAAVLLGAAPAQASPKPAAGWYMMVNDYYDGGSGDDGGKMWCLSTNNQTLPGGGDTHYVYLAVCSPSTATQWCTTTAPPVTAGC